MQESFDPYYKWLAIPPRDQPPNHYRLLGIQLFERDDDVIEAAADQRMAHLRALQNGSHVSFSQRLLNEVAQARVCLLDSRRREPYDRELRESLPPPPRALPVASSIAAPPSPAPAPAPAPTAISLSTTAATGSKRRRLQRQLVRMAALASVAAVALVLCGWLATAPSKRDERTAAPPNEMPRAVNTRSSNRAATPKPDASLATDVSPETPVESRSPTSDSSPHAAAAQPSRDTPVPPGDVPDASASPHPAADPPASSIAAFQLPESTAAAPVEIRSWFAVDGADDIRPPGAAGVCSPDRSLNTALTWARSPEEAAVEARRAGKLVFVIHVSGNFEDPGFT